MARNPFEHHHPHHHDDNDAAGAALDPAQESLADALRVSFFLLKIVMIVLLAWYVFSNVFNVREQEVAVRLRFGNIVGDAADARVIDPGGPHLSFPYPIDELIRVPTSVRQVTVDEAFWFAMTEQEKAMSSEQLATMKGGSGGMLSSERDGYLVTGDANVIHAQWSVTYLIGGDGRDNPRFDDNVIDYVTNVGGPDQADRIVHAAAERGIVTFAAKQAVDDMYRGLNLTTTSQLKGLIQDSLDLLKSGLHVTNVEMVKRSIPPSVLRAFNAVTSAENERTQKIAEAGKVRVDLLHGAAGEAHESLWDLIRRWEIARNRGEADAAAKLEAELAQAYETLEVSGNNGSLKISGEVAKLINEAESYRTQVRRNLEAETERFLSYLEQYETTPDIIRKLLWEDTMKRVFSGRIEPIFVPRDAQLEIVTNRNLELQRKWSEQDLKEADEQAAKDKLKRR